MLTKNLVNKNSSSNKWNQYMYLYIFITILSLLKINVTSYRGILIKTEIQDKPSSIYT